MSKKKRSATEYEVHVGDGVEIETFTDKKKAQKFVRDRLKNGREVAEIAVYAYRELSTKRFVR